MLLSPQGLRPLTGRVGGASHDSHKRFWEEPGQGCARRETYRDVSNLVPVGIRGGKDQREPLTYPRMAPENWSWPKEISTGN